MRPGLAVSVIAASGLAILLASGTSTAAQQGPTEDALAMGQVQSLVLTFDMDRLLDETWFGRRFSADLLERGEALAAENRAIEAELTAEVRSLTERRPNMEPDAFRAEADAFDARVQAIRAEQDAKESALDDAVAAGRDDFIEATRPVLTEIMIESGAVIVIERRDVFLHASAIDITDEAIAMIDDRIGADDVPSGPNEPATDPTSEQLDVSEPDPTATDADPAGDGTADGG